MNIAVDLRSLQTGTISGVENYTRNLLEHLLTLDKNNFYTLFYSGFKRANLNNFNFINTRILKSSMPNRMLNICLKFGLIDLQKFLGSPDIIYLPNLNVININQNAKLAITVHDLSPVIFPEFYDLKRHIWHKFLNIKKILSRANIVFAVSNSTKRDVIKLFNLPDEKVKVVYPGVDANWFNPNMPTDKLRETRNKYGLPGDYFLFLNTVEPRKNLLNALRAFELANLKSHLVIAGKKGWKTGKIFKAIKKSAKVNKIHYIGYVEEPYKPALIKMAKAILYPSFYEGFGFQALEAMFVGTPTIASQITSLPEVLGDSGLLVSPYNLSDLAKAMIELELRDILTQKGMERAQNFTWDMSAAQIIHYLNQL